MSTLMKCKFSVFEKFIFTDLYGIRLVNLYIFNYYILQAISYFKPQHYFTFMWKYFMHPLKILNSEM